MTDLSELEREITDLLAARAASASPPADAWDRLVAELPPGPVVVVDASAEVHTTLSREDDPVHDYVPKDDGGRSRDDTATLATRRWTLGVVTAVAAAILLVVGVVVVLGDRDGGDVVTEPVSVPSVVDGATPDVANPADAPGGFDPVLGYRWWRIPHDDGAFGHEGVYEPAFGGNDPEDMTEHADRRMISVTAGGPGLVAVGSSAVGGGIETDSSAAAVWTSVDGIDWSPVPNLAAELGGPGGQAMASLTVGGPGLVAVGGEGLASFRDGEGWSSRHRAAVWTSVDGLTWSRVPHDEAVFGSTGDADMRSVTAGGPGLVAVGFECESKCGDGGDVDAAVWTSVDGLTWSRVAHKESVFGGAGPQTMTSVTAGGPGLVAVGIDGTDETMDAAVWTSVDGLTWSRVLHDDAVFGGENAQQMRSVTRGGPGLVAVGADGIWGDGFFGWQSSGDFVGAAAVWTSVDGLTWSRVAHEEAVFGGAGGLMNSVSSGGPGLVAVGSEASDDDLHAAVWTSVDGINWSRVAHDDAVFAGELWREMHSVTFGGRGLVAVGGAGADPCCRGILVNASDGAVWVATPEG